MTSTTSNSSALTSSSATTSSTNTSLSTTVANTTTATEVPSTTSQTTTQTTQTTTEKDGKMEEYKIVLIAAAGVVTLVLLIALLLFLLRRRRNRKKPPPPELPHPDTLNMQPPREPNGTSRPNYPSSQSLASLVQEEELPSAGSYEDPETAATVPVIINTKEKESSVYQNMQSPHSQVSPDESSFGVYVQPVEKRPSGGREGSGEFESTYIAMDGPCGQKAKAPPIPTHPDVLYDEGKFEQVYTVPTNVAGSPPLPSPCGTTNLGYVNLPQPSGPDSQEQPPTPVANMYMNVLAGVNHPYRNLNQEKIALPSPASVEHRVLLQQPVDAAPQGAKRKLKTPPKTNPKSKTEKLSAPAGSPASSTAETGDWRDRGDKPHSLKTKDVHPLRVPSSTPTKPLSPMTSKLALTPPSIKASRSAEVSSDSEEEREGYENFPEGVKRDYQNVPNKKTGPHSSNGHRNESPVAVADGAAKQSPAVTPKKNQPGARMVIPGAVSDELKKKLGRPK